MNQYSRPVGYIPPDTLREPLYVVTVVSNAMRWKSKWKLFERFAKHVIQSGAVLISVEIRYGKREFAVEYSSHHLEETESPLHSPRKHHHIRLTTDQWVWNKEAGTTVGVQHLATIDPDWSKVAWIDCDFAFVRPNWVGAAIHELETKCDIIQLFDHGQDIDPEYRVLREHVGFVANYMKNPVAPPQPVDGYWRRGWPGGGWACTRDFWDIMGGMMGFAIGGSGDNLQALSMVNEVESIIPKGCAPGYREAILAWQRRVQLFGPKIGYITGTAQHYWHGPKSLRGYGSRNKILVKHQYDPMTDLVMDWQGLPRLVDDHTPRMRGLRDDLTAMFGRRNEDSIEVR